MPVTAAHVALLTAWVDAGGNLIAAETLQGLLPAASAAATLATLTRDGAGVAFEIQMIKGISYAVFPALAGSYQATYSAP